MAGMNWRVAPRGLLALALAVAVVGCGKKDEAPPAGDPNAPMAPGYGAANDPNGFGGGGQMPPGGMGQDAGAMGPNGPGAGGYPPTGGNQDSFGGGGFAGGGGMPAGGGMNGGGGMPAGGGMNGGGGGDAGERQDFGVPPTAALHAGAPHGPTPTQIPGGRLITTSELVALQRSAGQKLVILEVLGAPQTLPNAFRAVPAAAPGDYKDQTQQQFSQVLRQLTQGDMNAPIVTYCASTQCWMSYNAALRAINAGYKNVLWYRGGLEAWQRAGLPLAGGGGAQQGPPPNYPQQPPNYPPQQGGYPGQQPQYPPGPGGQGGYPGGQQPGYPQQGGYPPQQGGYPGQQPQYPQQQYPQGPGA